MQELLHRIGLRELRMLLLGLGAAVTLAMVAGVILPKLKALGTANSALLVLEEASQDGAELERHMQRRQAEIEELRYRLQGDMSNLPAKQVESYIIGRLQKVSWNNNVELVSVQPASGDQVQVFQEMLFKVQLIGNYADLYGWLWEARHELGFVVVKELSLKRHDEVDDEPLLHASLNLASYRTIE